MKSIRPSSRKASQESRFLELHIDLRFLIYDALFNDIEARFNDLSENPPVIIESPSPPYDAIVAIRRTARKTLRDIDKWLLSKPAANWAPNFGFFSPSLTSWKLQVTWYGLYPKGFKRQDHCKHILAKARAKFQQFSDSPYRDNVRELHFVLTGPQPGLWKRIPEITRGVSKFRNLQTLLVSWADESGGHRKWHNDFFHDLYDQLNKGEAEFGVASMTDEEHRNGTILFAREGLDQ